MGTTRKVVYIEGEKQESVQENNYEDKSVYTNEEIVEEVSMLDKKETQNQLHEGGNDKSKKSRRSSCSSSCSSNSSHASKTSSVDTVDILKDPRYLSYAVLEILKNINKNLVLLNENLSKK
jgi:single-stranded DNA-binding protein